MLFFMSVLSLVAGGIFSQLATKPTNYSFRLEQCGGLLLVFGLMLLGIALNQAMQQAKPHPLTCVELPAQCSPPEP